MWHNLGNPDQKYPCIWKVWTFILILETFRTKMSLVTTEGALAVSVTVNVCCLTFFTSRPVIRHVLRKLENKFPVARKLLDLNNENGSLISRIATDQLVTWILVIYSLALLIAGDIIYTPFGTINNYALIEIAFCVKIGKHAFKIVQDSFFCRYVSLYAIHMITHLVTVCCYSIFVSYKQNSLYGVIGLLMEAHYVFHDLLRILKKMDYEKHRRVYIRVAVINCATTVIFRGLVPVAFLTSAFIIQNPFTMHYVTLSFFFLGIIFYSILSLWVIRASILSLRKCLLARKEWTYKNALGLTNVVKSDETPLNENVLKNNFCYLKPYSNINITGDTTATTGSNRSSEKLNIKRLWTVDNDYSVPSFTVPVTRKIDNDSTPTNSIHSSLTDDTVQWRGSVA